MTLSGLLFYNTLSRGLPPPTLGSYNARRAISIPKVSRKYAISRADPAP